MKPKAVAYGILNDYGEFWTTKTFDSIVDAEMFVKRFWSKSLQQIDLSQFKIIRVKITPYNLDK